MMSFAPGTRVYLACQPVDMRKGFNGLAAQVSTPIGMDPYICVGRRYVAARPHGA